jgi:hypothetical protein
MWCNTSYVYRDPRNRVELTRVHVPQLCVKHKTEHCRYIKTNDPKSAYTLHVLNNRHEFGPINSTMTLIRSRKKGSHMNTLENFYIHDYHQNGTLIPEQQLREPSILFKLINNPNQAYSAGVT